MNRSKIQARQPNTFALLAAAAFVAVALFCSEAFGSSGTVNVNQDGLALDGYDPVAYFETGKAERGKSAHTASHEGATYYFSSEARRELFQRDPALYVPTYGGFCAYGVAVGQKFNGDPEVFAIVQGRLYLQLDRATQTLWKSELSKNIAIADRTWPVIQEVPAAVLND